MKNKTGENISYKGEVTVKLVKNGKVNKTRRTHNEGSVYLFQYIANCLAGSFQQDKKPWYIRLYSVEGQSGEPLDPSTATEVTTTYLPVASTTTYSGADENGEYAYVEHTFIVPGTYLVQEASANAIAMYSLENINDKSKWSAYAMLSESIGEVDAGTNAVILWKMTVSNKQ